MWLVNTVTGMFVGMAIFYMGFWAGKNHQRPIRPAEKDLSICSCAHTYSVHNDDGVCNVTTFSYNKDSGREIYKAKCPCVRYDGVPPAHIMMNS